MALHAGGLPVYQAYPGSCDYVLPDQPFVRIGLIAETNRDFAQRLARAIAPRLEALRLPVRDAVATYPAPLAEHDPCQVLAVTGSEVDHWDVSRF